MRLDSSRRHFGRSSKKSYRRGAHKSHTCSRHFHFVSQIYSILLFPECITILSVTYSYRRSFSSYAYNANTKRALPRHLASAFQKYRHLLSPQFATIAGRAGWISCRVYGAMAAFCSWSAAFTLLAAAGQYILIGRPRNRRARRCAPLPIARRI